MPQTRTPSLAAAVLALALGADARAAPVETPVELPGGAGPLRGTQLAPAVGAGSPVVVILPGSGPTDRDGNSPLGVRASTYRLLAEALAARGITTIRVDKRGMFGSAGAATDANRVMLTELAGDARAWAADARRRTGASCVWLLGHSEGALVALLAAQVPDGLCGLVLVSAPGRRLGDVLRAQLRDAVADPTELVLALDAITALEDGRRVDPSRLSPSLAPLFHEGVQDFLIASLRHDPVALLRATTVPVVVVQGATDLQVTLDDARRLEGARTGVSLVVLPGVNHVLKASTTDRGPNVATYADPALPLGPGVVDAVADFVLAPR